MHNIVHGAVAQAREINQRHDLSTIEIGLLVEIFQADDPVLVSRRVEPCREFRSTPSNLRTGRRAEIREDLPGASASKTSKTPFWRFWRFWRLGPNAN